MDYKVMQAWNGYKVGETITDPFTDEFNLAGQVANGVLVEVKPNSKKDEA
jgi:uncharacterized membrane-anchored protein